MASPDEHSTVLTMNRQFSSLFRVDERLMLGKPLWELLEAMRIPASIKHDLKIAWGNAIEHGQGLVLGEFQMIGPQGNPLDLRWYTNPVHQGDQLIGRVFTFYDMTPERTAERLRTELLARLSHELRTPLTSIHGFAEMLTEFSNDDLSPAAAEYAHIIYKSATRLKDVFADLIEITRADTGEIRLYPSETYLPEIIEKVVDGLHNPIEERRQTINIAIEDGLPAALVDLERIQRVVHILLNNAINHSPESGEIDLSIRYIRSSKDLPPSAPADTATPCIIVRIHDNGAGLSKEDVDRVFLPLYRTYASQSQKMDGAGLGLAIAHKYIELHGGNLWATHATRKEPGGQFFFTVPVNESA
jgi:signal transduction histidine kinase